MMRPSRPIPLQMIILFVLFVVAVVATPAAWAEPFGGFSADETQYLVGRDTICSPLPMVDGTSRGIPSCARAEATSVAARKFRRGTKQQGSRAKYSASSRSTSLTVRALEGTGARAGLTITWEATDPISRITAVYLSNGGELLAVEYESRFGGRARTDVVAFMIGKSKDSSPEPPAPVQPDSRPAAKDPTTPAPAASKELEKALSKARRLSRRGANKALIAAFRRVLELDPDHSEGLYGLARGLARRRQVDGALAELEKLAASSREDAIVWQVEARFDKAFASLRSNSRFRKAVGLDRPPGTRPTAVYERLVGFSSTWEQPEIKCEQAQINIDFARTQRKFALRVTTRCGGYKDVTRLKGRWQVAKNGQITLILPNKSKADEIVTCALQICSDSSNEDCLICGVDSDLSFTARPVRR